MNKDSLKHHVDHLQQKHDELDKEIQMKYRLHENDLKLETLKKLKLHIKDEIVKIQKDLNSL